MSYSDEDSEHEVTEEGGGDAKFKEYWSKKARRRSSVYKDAHTVGDSLGLQEHSKIQMLLAKNGNEPLLLRKGGAPGRDQL